MDLEKQVCSVKLGERLKELGVSQESLFYWTHSEKWGIMPKRSIDFTGNPTSVFTAAELVQMNGNVYGISFSDKENKFYSGCAIDHDVVYYDSFSDACATKLINAIQNEWISIVEVNKRLLL